MKKSETSQEYYLVMKELTSRSKIEPEALIQYLIDGITDDSNNKLVLYGSRKLEERERERDFKEKLKIYEDIRKKNLEKGKSEREKENALKKKEVTKKSTAFKKTEEKEQDSDMRCYN